MQSPKQAMFTNGLLAGIDAFDNSRFKSASKACLKFQDNESQLWKAGFFIGFWMGEKEIDEQDKPFLAEAIELKKVNNLY